MVPGGQSCGYLEDFLSCGSLWMFEDCRGQWGYFLFSISLARWKYTHVFPKDEFFSASSTERRGVLCFLSWKNQLDRRILILVLSHFSSWNSKSIIHNPLLEIHQKMLHFLLSLIYFAVYPERVTMFNVHYVLSPPIPPQTWEEKQSLWDLSQMLFVSSDWANPDFCPWTAFVRQCCSGEMGCQEVLDGQVREKMGNIL